MRFLGCIFYRKTMQDGGMEMRGTATYMGQDRARSEVLEKYGKSMIVRIFRKVLYNKFKSILMRIDF